MRRWRTLGVLASAAVLGLLWRTTTLPSSNPARAQRQSAVPAPAASPRRSAFDRPFSDRIEPGRDLVRLIAMLHEEIRFWDSHLTGRVEDKEAEAILNKRLQALGTLVTDENCAEIVRALSASELQSPIGISTLRRWLVLDPVAATSEIARRTDATPAQAFLVAEVLIEHPADLLDLCRQWPDSTWVQTVLEHAAGQALAVDPRAAVELARHVTSPEVQVALLPRIVDRWVQLEPDAAMEWVASISDSTLRDSLVAAAALGLADLEPARAANWLVGHAGDRETLKNALPQLIGTWATEDRDAAWRWAGGLADAELRAAAVRGIPDRS